MKPVATIAIRRHGIGNWRDDAEPDNSKLEISLFRVIGGDSGQALKTLRKALEHLDRRQLVALTFEGAGEITASHLEVCQVVLKDCSSRNFEVALCAFGLPEVAEALPEELRPRTTYPSVADLVAQLSGQGASGGSAPTHRTSKAAPRRRIEPVAGGSGRSTV